jgi:UDP-N-acetylglucosamine 3-dehydrogenase
LKKVNLGIIGLGNQGKIHLRNALRLEGAKVVGVADVSERALSYAKKIGVRNVYKNYEDLIKNNELDAVVISLPNFLHLETAVKVAEAGKEIMLEKPLARNVEEGKKILASVKSNGVRLMMGYDMRFNPPLKEIKHKIVDGFFGDIQEAGATNVSGGPFGSRSDKIGPIPVSPWWFDKDLSGGGVLLDLGSHLIDFFSWYFGEVDSVRSILGYMFNLDTEDVATCVLVFKDGPTATFNVGWFSREFLLSVQICGTAKNLLVQLAPISNLKIVRKDFRSKIGRPYRDPYCLELEYFVNSLQRDEELNPSCEEGLTCQRLVALAYKNSLVRNANSLKKEA